MTGVFGIPALTVDLANEIVKLRHPDFKECPEPLHSTLMFQWNEIARLLQNKIDKSKMSIYPVKTDS